MTDQLIRRFVRDGIMSGKNLAQSQDTFRRDILIEMKDEGWTPALDMDPVFRWSWIKEDYYRFTYTMQGVFVGKDKSWETEGVSNGKRIPSTPKDK